MSSVITKSSKKKDKRQVNKKNCNLEKEYRDCIRKKQQRQDWDHKAYHDAPSAIYCAVAQ